MIQASELISCFRESLDDGWGYIYGISHEKWSQAKQAAYARDYAGDLDRQNSVTYGGKWAGHWVTDCSGLFHYWAKVLGGSFPHGSNSIWDKCCTAKGQLKNGIRPDGKPLQPGTAVFTSSGDRHNHIGLYIGDGWVIEARGAQYGVVKTSIKDRRWTHWGELRGVSYESKEVIGMTATVVLPAGKSGSTVRMRSGQSTKSDVICNVPVGTQVEVLEDLGQWCRIRYNDKTGYMMSDYLEYGQGDETGDLTPEQLEKIEKSLRGIEQALQDIAKWTDDIGRIVGRG